MSDDGYDRTMKLAEERPDLLPLLRFILDKGDDGFNEALDELTRRGLLTIDPARSIEPPV